MEGFIAHAGELVAAILAAIAIWRTRQKPAASRAEQLRSVVTQALDAALAHQAQHADQATQQSLRVLALPAAVAFDLKADGKRDFSDKELALALSAEAHARGLKW